MNQPSLQRKVGMLGAVMMGLGSIVGTGAFVSIGIGYSVAGPMVLPAILVATVVATLNGLSSAQLAANHPVSGGTYAYGYRWLNPSLGFSAGAMFLVAKSASAATAALGCALYLFELVGWDSAMGRMVLACALVLVMTVLVAGGLRRTNWMNIAIVSITLASLLLLIATGVWFALEKEVGVDVTLDFTPSFFECCALMFVAFTGYGRIATLGEEIVEPKKNIPRAIILTLIISGLLYAGIGWVVVAVNEWSNASQNGQLMTLKSVAESLNSPTVFLCVSIGAFTAMLGVLLNLVLGLSRVWFAMGRNGDLPAWLGNLDEQRDSPTAAIVLTGLTIAGLTLVGDVKLTWAFSAFTVLIYYAITNLAATRLTREERYFPAFLPWLGFVGCLSLAFFIHLNILLVGLAVLLVANLLRWILHRNQPGDSN